MGNEDPVAVAAKDQRQRVEQMMGAVPDVFVGTEFHRRLKKVTVSLPDRAVHAVGADDQVAAGEAVERLQPRFEAKLDAAAPAMILEDAQELDAAQAGKDAAVDRYGLVVVDDDLLIPDL